MRANELPPRSPVKGAYCPGCHKPATLEIGWTDSVMFKRISCGACGVISTTWNGEREADAQAEAAETLPVCADCGETNEFPEVDARKCVKCRLELPRACCATAP